MSSPFGQHDCHPSTEPCPPCLERTSKPCLCRKTVQNNVMCYMTSIMCSNLCLQPLPCGHQCQRGCHRPPCSESNTCKQLCGKQKPCGHPCTSSCHHEQPDCTQLEPCSTRIPLRCACGHLTATQDCGYPQTEGPDRSLKCTQSCAAQQRTRMLAHALDISTIDHHSAPTHHFSSTSLAFASRHKAFTMDIEQRLNAFGADTDRMNLRFQAMKAQYRTFIQDLVNENYAGFRAECQDREPYRSVVVVKIQDKNWYVDWRAPASIVPAAQYMVEHGMNETVKSFETMRMVKRAACCLMHRHVLAKTPRVMKLIFLGLKVD
jgi:transcriptional repressor NF-X1